MKNAGRNAGFTLIELLVVIAIIGLLVAIMMPSLSSAKDMAKGAVCLNNTRSIGLGFMQYQTDNAGMYPMHYYYLNDANSSGGYVHWSGILSQGKYFDATKALVCPSHKIGGWAPTNFTAAKVPDPPSGQTTLNAGVDDIQAPHMTYVGNEVILPRLKMSSLKATLRTVTADEVDNGTGTILVAEYTDSIKAIMGSSPTGGDALKTHRPTNGIKVDGGGVFDAETNYTVGTGVTGLGPVEARKAVNDGQGGTLTHHIQYVNPDMHRRGSNYTFADGHAQRVIFEDTFDKGHFMWGKKLYSGVGTPDIKPADAP